MKSESPGVVVVVAVAVVVAFDPVDTLTTLLFHKTTRREVYDNRRARHPYAGDVLLVNDRASDEESDFDFLYPLDQSIEEKISTTATEIYGAAGVEFSAKAKKQIAS